MKKLFVPLLIIVTVALADQLSKLWVLNNLDYNIPREILGRFFMFTLIYNDGGAMGTNFGSSAYYLISSILILLFVMYYLYVNRYQRLFAIPLALIGNLIDRIRLGKVVDFIDVDFFDLNLFGYQLERWWTFNIADSAILVSILFLLFLMLFKKDAFTPLKPTDEHNASRISENSIETEK